MMFNNLRKYTKLYKENYSLEDRLNAMYASLIAILIILIPVVLVLVQLYYLFLMRIYLIVTITLIVFTLMAFIYLLFKYSILKNIKIVEDIKYSSLILKELLCIFIVFLAIYLCAVIFFIPIFVI